MQRPPRRIALLLDALGQGGVERQSIARAGALAARGFQVDLVVLKARGALRADVPDGVRLICLDPNARRRRDWLAGADRGDSAWGRASPAHAWRRLLAHLSRHPGAVGDVRMLKRACPRAAGLSVYLRVERPAVLMTSLATALSITTLAAADVPASVRTIGLVHGPLHRDLRVRHLRRAQGLLAAMDRCVTVSAGIAAELVASTGLPSAHFVPIHNAVNEAALAARADASPPHAWLQQPREAPVLLAVGRLHPAKDHATLLRAFARLRREREGRLLIFGDGAERRALERQAAALGVATDVAMPGWIAEPWPAMRAADVLVLASRYEGFGNVLAEALACGCPVVSTDADGPREILDGGRFGELVAVGDDAALAAAIARALDAPLRSDALRARAAAFTHRAMVDAYERLIETLIGRGGGCAR